MNFLYVISIHEFSFKSQTNFTNFSFFDVFSSFGAFSRQKDGYVPVLSSCSVAHVGNDCNDCNLPPPSYFCSKASVSICAPIGTKIVNLPSSRENSR